MLLQVRADLWMFSKIPYSYRKRVLITTFYFFGVAALKATCGMFSKLRNNLLVPFNPVQG